MTNKVENYKYDRAIIHIRRIKTEETPERYIDRHKAFDLAINALEKQILRRPIGDFDSCPHYRCPNCKCSVKMYENDNTYPHCGFCGQALDWSDNDE